MSRRIMQILWRDAASFEGWQDGEACDLAPVAIESIGFVVKETKDAYLVSTSRDKDDSYADPLCIPKAGVVAAYELQVSE